MKNTLLLLMLLMMGCTNTKEIKNIDMNLTSFMNEKLPSVIADPFGKTNIIAVRIHYTKSSFSGKFSCSGTVEFQNNNTKGEQRFEAETFDEVILKIKSMVDNL